MTLTIISLIIISAYVAVTVKLFGVPYSLSDTHYLLEEKRKGLGWLFTAMCWGVGFTLLPAILDITPDSYQFTAFLACAGLIFVGAAPQFKLPLTNAVHYGSAAVCVVFSQIWVGLTCWWVLLPVWVGFIAYVAIGMGRHVSDSLLSDLVHTKPMFWAEIAALVAMYVTVFIAL